MIRYLNSVEPGESPYSTPELYKEYPLIMTSGYRQPFYFLSQYRNIPWLRSFMEYPTAQIIPRLPKSTVSRMEIGFGLNLPEAESDRKPDCFPGS